MRPPTPDGTVRVRWASPPRPPQDSWPRRSLRRWQCFRPGQASLADAGLNAGGCFVRPLPVDTTCAAAARRFFREAVASLPIPSGLLHDGVTMASELAANTLHAHRKSALGGALPAIADGRARDLGVPARQRPQRASSSARSSTPSGAGTRSTMTGMAKAPADSVSGRGLQVVDGLSAGQWGCHPPCPGSGTARRRVRRSGSPCASRPRRCPLTSAGRATALSGWSTSWRQCSSSAAWTGIMRADAERDLGAVDQPAPDRLAARRDRHLAHVIRSATSGWTWPTWWT